MRYNLPRQQLAMQMFDCFCGFPDLLSSTDIWYILMGVFATVTDDESWIQFVKYFVDIIIRGKNINKIMISSAC